MSDFAIEEVQDVERVWPDLEVLMRGILDYHRPWDERVLRDDWSSRIRAHLVVPGEGLILLARDGAGSAVAFLNGTITRETGIFHEVVAFIDNAYVAEGARAAGIGTALVEYFERWAGDRGVTEIRLHVQIGNALGERFWARAGFNPFQYRLRKPLGASK